MNAAAFSHYENASFLRELAEKLPQIFPGNNKNRTELLQRLANEESAQAEYEDWVHAKVAVSREDTRPGMTADQLRKSLNIRAQALRNAT